MSYISIEDYSSHSNPWYDYSGYKVTYSFEEGFSEVQTKSNKERAIKLAKDTVDFLANSRLGGAVHKETIENGFLVYITIPLGDQLDITQKLLR